MQSARGSVPGSGGEHDIAFYGLSTCIWCRRAREFLETHGVGFRYVYVDLLPHQEREDVLAEVRARSSRPSVSFPTVVVDGRTCVVGYDPDQLREVLGL